MADESFYKNEDKKLLTEQIKTVSFRDGEIAIGKDLQPGGVSQLVDLLTRYRPMISFNKEICHFMGMEHTIETDEKEPLSSHPFRVSPVVQQIDRKQSQE